MIRLETEALVPAAPERVWRVLTDFAAMPRWNPFILDLEGVAEEGARLRMWVRAPDGSGREFRVAGRVVRLDPGRALEWRGGVPGVLTGLHFWRLAEDPGGTRLVHGEEFGGLVPHVAGRRRILAMRPSYEAMNQELIRYLARTPSGKGW